MGPVLRKREKCNFLARRGWQMNGCGDIEPGMRIYRGPLAAVITRSSYPAGCKVVRAWCEGKNENKMQNFKVIYKVKLGEKVKMKK